METERESGARGAGSGFAEALKALHEALDEIEARSRRALPSRATLVPEIRKLTRELKRQAASRSAAGGPEGGRSDPHYEEPETLEAPAGC